MISLTNPATKKKRQLNQSLKMNQVDWKYLENYKEFWYVSIRHQATTYSRSVEHCLHGITDHLLHILSNEICLKDLLPSISSSEILTWKIVLLKNEIIYSDVESEMIYEFPAVIIRLAIFRVSPDLTKLVFKLCWIRKKNKTNEYINKNIVEMSKV